MKLKELVYSFQTHILFKFDFHYPFVSTVNELTKELTKLDPPMTDEKALDLLIATYEEYNYKNENPEDKRFQYFLNHLEILLTSIQHSGIFDKKSIPLKKLNDFLYRLPQKDLIETYITKERLSFFFNSITVGLFLYDLFQNPEKLIDLSIPIYLLQVVTPNNLTNESIQLLGCGNVTTILISFSLQSLSQPANLFKTITNIVNSCILTKIYFQNQNFTLWNTDAFAKREARVLNPDAGPQAEEKIVHRK